MESTDSQIGYDVNLSKRQRGAEMKMDEPFHSSSMSHKKLCGVAMIPVNQLAEMLEIDDVASGKANESCLDGACQEDLVYEVMKSLEEEIGTGDGASLMHFSTEECMSSALEKTWCCLSNEINNSVVHEQRLDLISSPPSVLVVDEAQDNEYGCVDISFLLHASDEQLGLSQSPRCINGEHGEYTSFLGNTMRLDEPWQSGTELEDSERISLLEHLVELPYVDENENCDQDWLKRAVLTLETLMIPSATQNAVQESSTTVLEAGVGL